MLVYRHFFYGVLIVLFFYAQAIYKEYSSEQLPPEELELDPLERATGKLRSFNDVLSCLNGVWDRLDASYRRRSCRVV
jgi:hypothetical protein